MARDNHIKKDTLVPRSGRKPPKASAYIADELRAYIIGNDIAAGSKLMSEAELIEHFGLSRATVREALRLLESDGLITIKRGPTGGVSAAKPSATQISRTLATMVGFEQLPLSQLFELRLAIEPPAAAAAAKRITPENASRLMEAAKGHEHGGRMVEERVDFHLLVGELSGNALFHTILAALHDVLTWHVNLEPLTEKDVAGTIRAHVRIAEAIGSGKGKEARDAMHRHLERFAARMEEEDRLEAPIIPRSAWLRARSSL